MDFSYRAIGVVMMLDLAFHGRVNTQQTWGFGTQSCQAPSLKFLEWHQF